MQRSEDGCDMRRFGSFKHNHCTCKRCKTVLNLSKAKTVVQRVTVVKFGVDTVEAEMVLAVLE